MKKSEIINNLKNNWKSGLTVSLISIPLSISLAIASQTSPVAGIITAVWAGLMAALLGGSRFNIVGPTGALSGVLATYSIIHGADTLAALAVVSGVLILISYLLRLEKFLVFVPASAVQGFTLGVAFIIAFNQFNYAFGLQGLEKHEYFVQNLVESFKHLSLFSPHALMIFLFFVVALFGTLKLTPKIPAVIVWAPIGILVGFLSKVGVLPLSIITLGDQFGNLQLALFQAPRLFFDYSLLVAGVTVAVIAILETIISAKIADGMTKTKHNPRKELIGLGVANLVSGLMGGIPATAALARTAANIKSGATHNTSAAVSSVAVAIICVFLLSYFRFMPMPVIAAILVFVAARMIDITELIAIIRHDKMNLILAILVAFITVYYDPIIGILFGTAVSLLIFVEKLSHGHFTLALNDKKRGLVEEITGEKIVKDPAHHDTLVYSIKGSLVYLNGQSHVARFHRQLTKYENVIIRLRELYYLDLDGIAALDEIVELVQHQGKTVAISSIPALLQKNLEHESEAYKLLKKKKLVFKKTEDALKHFGYKV